MHRHMIFAATMCGFISQPGYADTCGEQQTENPDVLIEDMVRSIRISEKRAYDFISEEGRREYDPNLYDVRVGIYERCIAFLYTAKMLEHRDGDRVTLYFEVPDLFIMVENTTGTIVEFVISQ